MKKLLLFTTAFLGANSITIYNNNLAYVSEDKNISLQSGLQTIKYTNLPKSIIINSIAPEIKGENVKIRSLQFNKSQSFARAVLEQNLNKDISFFAKDKKIISGKLKKISPIIVESDGRFYTVNSIEALIFSSYPKKDSINSYLELNIDSKESQSSVVALNYLINGINWFSNYTITLKDSTLNMKVWATITNNSDKEFKNYKLNLIAGKLNRVRRDEILARSPMVRKSLNYAEAVEPAVAQVPSKSIEGYYLFKVPFSDTLAKNQTKQILLIDAKDIKYKIYAVATNRNFNRYGTQKLNFSQIIEFKNSSKNGLGLPLPSGLARVYKKGFYLGEDSISNTPKEQKIKLNTGEFFDIVGKKKIVEYINKKHYKKLKTEYSIKNRSNKKQSIKINEYIPRYGNNIEYKTSCQNNCTFTQKNAFTREYKIELDKNNTYTFYSEVEIFD